MASVASAAAASKTLASSSVSHPKQQFRAPKHQQLLLLKHHHHLSLPKHRQSLLSRQPQLLRPVPLHQAALDLAAAPARGGLQGPTQSLQRHRLQVLNLPDQQPLLHHHQPRLPMLLAALLPPAKRPSTIRVLSLMLPRLKSAPLMQLRTLLKGTVHSSHKLILKQMQTLQLARLPDRWFPLQTLVRTSPRSLTLMALLSEAACSSTAARTATSRTSM